DHDDSAQPVIDAQIAHGLPLLGKPECGGAIPPRHRTAGTIEQARVLSMAKGGRYGSPGRVSCCSALAAPAIAFSGPLPVYAGSAARPVSGRLPLAAPGFVPSGRPTGLARQPSAPTALPW